MKYIHGEKSLKAQFVIYADLECLLKEEQSCQNNTEKSYTEKKAKHKPSGYAWSLICSMQQKAETFFIEEKIVLNIFVEN